MQKFPGSKYLRKQKASHLHTACFLSTVASRNYQYHKCQTIEIFINPAQKKFNPQRASLNVISMGLLFSKRAGTQL